MRMKWYILSKCHGSTKYSNEGITSLVIFKETKLETSYISNYQGKGHGKDEARSEARWAGVVCLFDS